MTPQIYNKSKKEPLQPRLNQSNTRKKPRAAGLTDTLSFPIVESLFDLFNIDFGPFIV